MTNIHIPVSLGELVDKITILEIKRSKITDAAKLRNVLRELDLLEHVWKFSQLDRGLIEAQWLQLRAVNEGLWEIEDRKRLKEAAASFDEEFIALARSKPGKLNYGTPGAGTSFHFNNVFLANKLGIEAEHVPYKGESAALTDLAGGAIDYMLAGQAAKAFVDSGRIRALAVTSKQRVAAYPNVPTFRELGIDFTTDGWVGYVAPMGVPVAVLDRLNTAFVKAIQSPAVQRSFATMGYEPVGSSRQEFRKIIEGASRRYADILRTGAVKLTP